MAEDAGVIAALHNAFPGGCRPATEGRAGGACLSPGQYAQMRDVPASGGGVTEAVPHQ